MPLPGLGLNCNLGIGRETVWGTSVARTKFNELVRFSGGLKIDRSFGAAFRGLQKRRHFPAKRTCEFETVLEGYYEGFEHFLKALFNTSAPTTGPTNVSVYTHTFTPATALLAGWSVEIEKDVQAFLYEGSKASSGTWSWSIDQLMQLAIQWFAEDETQVSHTAPTYPPEKPLRWDQTTVEVDDVLFDCRSVEITLDNKLNTDRRKLGTTLIKEPARGGQMSVTGSFEADFEAVADFYNKYANDTEFKFEVITTGATIAGSSPTTPETHIVTLPRCIATGKPIEIVDEGVIKAGLEFEALFHVTSALDLMKVVVQNSVSTVI